MRTTSAPGSCVGYSCLTWRSTGAPPWISDNSLPVTHSPFQRTADWQIAYSGLEKFKEAIEVADHLLEIDPSHGYAHLVRGSAYLKLRRLEEATAAFDELLRTNHCPLLARCGLGLTAER